MHIAFKSTYIFHHFLRTQSVICSLECSVHYIKAQLSHIVIELCPGILIPLPTPKLRSDSRKRVTADEVSQGQDEVGTIPRLLSVNRDKVT